MGRIWIIACVACLAVVAVGQAGEDADRTMFTDSAPHLVEFSYGSGLGISWAHGFVGSTRLRWGLDVSGYDDSDDITNSVPDTPYSYDSSDSHYQLTVKVDVLFPLTTTGFVSWYGGLGPYFGYNTTTNENQQPTLSSITQPFYTRTVEIENYELGFRAVMGADYAINSQFSVYGEVGVEIDGEWQSYESSSFDSIFNINLGDVVLVPTSYERDGFRLNWGFETMRIGLRFRY